ncbi:hypothetical protein Y88_2030 [Novosphingobium nitrogenifigens DSM 19370]|uniref:Uncharacterized protein n=1 Tax=Novosphingobium nitrogenifigens DSM 19370 TaxID=983920 RepID=F1Z5P6_9SPHN|nr:hypothetical protein Y88_2030 [Novosphingobium nitrogenifigens DSM 19370]
MACARHTHKQAPGIYPRRPQNSGAVLQCSDAGFFENPSQTDFAAPALSPTRPPNDGTLWVVGWGRGPVP